MEYSWVQRYLKQLSLPPETEENSMYITISFYLWFVLFIACSRASDS